MTAATLLNCWIRTLLLFALCCSGGSVMRSQYPSWIDADIRQTLEHALLEAPAAGLPPPAANAYQQMLSDMAAQLRAKQYDIQHRQTQQAQQQAQQAHVRPAQSPHRHHHSERTHGTSSQRQSRDDSVIAQPQHQPQRLSHQAHPLSQSQGARRPAGAPPSRLPTRSPMRSSRDVSSSRSGRPSVARPASAAQPKVAQPRLTISVSPPLTPRSPRAAGGSGIGPISPARRTLSPSSSSSFSNGRLHGGHGSSGHAGGPPPPGGVWVPLEWFTDMESKLQNLAQMSGPASEQSQSRRCMHEIVPDEFSRAMGKDSRFVRPLIHPAH